VDTITKELWVQAAGGEKHLSEWVRERLNAAVTGEVGVGDRRLGGDGLSLGVESTASGDSVSRGSPSPVTAGSLVDACPSAAFHSQGGTCAECGVAFPYGRREVKPDFKPGTKI